MYSSNLDFCLVWMSIENNLLILLIYAFRPGQPFLNTVSDGIRSPIDSITLEKSSSILQRISFVIFTFRRRVML